MRTSKTEAETYREILLTNIAPNTVNPRKDFEGQDFEELVASIAVKGVISPILVRPMPDKRKKVEFEIVYGERRWRASMAVAEKNGGVKKATIPAIVRDMTDDEAWDAMIIENLLRENLSELEEAQAFKAAIDKEGKDAIPKIVERTGIHPRYIQRRVAVLELPKAALKAWETGKIKYGHLEQLLRLRDPKDVKKCVDQMVMNFEHSRPTSIDELRESIDEEAVELSWAKFDKKKEGCIECRQNTDFQGKLFGDDLATKRGGCLDSVCFRKKQGNWLTENWQKFGKDAGTNGFRFRDSLKYGTYKGFESWTGKPGKDCASCPDFVSLVNLRGKFETKQACIGKNSCFEATCRKESTKTKKKQSTSAGSQEPVAKEGPRVEWHGAFFREQFYHERIDAVLGDLGADHIYILRAALFAVLKSNEQARGQFAKDVKMIPEEQTSYFRISSENVWDKIIDMDEGTLRTAMKKTAIRIVLQSNHFSSMLNRVSEHIGIDLAKEWRIDREYLDKKTIGEIHEIGEKHGIFADEKAQAYLFETLGKKRGKFTTCKKEELIKVILESGVDLAGKVPAEILDMRNRYDRQLELEGEKECKTCRGLGEVPDPEDPDAAMDCPDCKGAGTVPIEEAASG
jgi:ParB family transcriptional regulator, chromosome partitioning protein